MTIALVPSAFLSNDLTAGTPSAAIDTTGANLIFGGLSYFSAAPTFTDSKGNTWAFIRRDNFFGNANLESYYSLGGSVGAGHTFTPTVNNGAISAAAFSGVKAASALDQQSGNVVTGVATVQAGAITPSENSCLVVALLYFETGTVTGIDGGFTLLSSAVGGSGTALAYLVQTTAVAANPLWTTSGTQTRMVAQLFSFKSTGAIATPLSVSSTFKHRQVVTRPRPFAPGNAR